MNSTVRTVLAAGLFTFMLAYCPRTHADDPEAILITDPALRASVGDWSLIQHQRITTQGGAKWLEKSAELWTVALVASDEVTISVEIRQTDGYAAVATRVVPRRGFRLRDVVGFHHAPCLSISGIASDTRCVGPRLVPCLKVFAEVTDGVGAPIKFELIVSNEIPASGFVCRSGGIEDARAGKVEFKDELVGHGRRGSFVWGRSALDQSMTCKKRRIE
jgi:hypothetical protein